MIEQWRPGWWFLDLFLAIKVCSKLTFCLKPTTTVSQRVSGCTSLTDHAVNYPYTVWSVIKVLLRTYWKPAVDSGKKVQINWYFRPKTHGRRFPAVFCCSIIDGPHGTHYQGEGNSIIYGQYHWDTLYF